MSTLHAPKESTSLWKTFLKPGWVFTAVLIIAFTYLAFTVLAPWQLHKNTRLEERNHLIEKAFHTDPVPFDQVFNADGTLPTDHEYQRVELHGTYLDDKEVVMRVRPVDGGPAYHALTPFRMDNGQTVLVNRGWQRPQDGKIPDSFIPAPAGEVTIVGYARLDEPKPSNGPITDQGRLQVHGINTEEIGAATGTTLDQDFVQLASDQPGVLTPFPLPTLDTGPHLSYGIQWIAFGILAPIGLGYFIWAELRERRRVEEENSELGTSLAASAPPAEQEHSETSKTEEPTPAPAARRRSRYGSKAGSQDHWARRDEERF